MLVASYAACSILRVLTQWGATLVLIYERERDQGKPGGWGTEASAEVL